MWRSGRQPKSNARPQHPLCRLEPPVFTCMCLLLRCSLSQMLHFVLQSLLLVTTSSSMVGTAKKGHYKHTTGPDWCQFSKWKWNSSQRVSGQQSQQATSRGTAAKRSIDPAALLNGRQPPSQDCITEAGEAGSPVAAHQAAACQACMYSKEPMPSADASQAHGDGGGVICLGMNQPANTPEAGGWHARRRHAWAEARGRHARRGHARPAHDR
jgi:hypothetical protein